MNEITFSMKLSVVSVIFAVFGLVIFVFSPTSLEMLSPWAVWSWGLFVGAASPVFTFSGGQPQSGQHYFGLVCNLSFLLVLIFILGESV